MTSINLKFLTSKVHVWCAFTITQHTFADTFYCRKRAPLPTDNLPRKVLPTVNRIADTLCVGKRSTYADS